MELAENASTYSKNVESLYTMVYSTLDSLSKTDGKGGSSSAILKKLRKRVVGFQELDAGFELLDSQFEQPARGIDMKSSEGIISNGSHLIRRVPLLLLPREDADKGGPGKSSTDPSKQQSTQYKTSSCWVSETSGCLLLDPKFELLETRDNLARGGRGSFGGRISMHGPLIAGTAPLPPQAEEAQSFYSVEDSNVIAEYDDAAMPDDSGFSYHPDIPSRMETPLLDNNTSLAPIESPSALFPPIPEDIAIKPLKDPWLELDPHSTVPGGRTIPLKTGRCYHELEDLHALPELVSLMNPTGEFGSKSDLFGPPCWPDLFEQITRDLEISAAKEEKRKAAQMAESRPATSQRQSMASMGPMPEEESSSSSEEDTSLPHWNESSRVSIAPTGLSRDEKRLQDERSRTALLEQVLENSKREYDEFIRQHLSNAQDADFQDSIDPFHPNNSSSLLLLPERVPEMLYASIRKWQDNLEPILEEQNARPSFDLDGYLVSILDKLTHISADDPTITAFLQEVEGEEIAAEESGEKPVSSFESLVKGEPKWNVCRLFLSTLILTNNGNVEIFENSDAVTPRNGERATQMDPASPNHASSFQIKLKNAEKNLKFAVQDNAGVTGGDIPILTNHGLPPLEPVGDVPFGEDDD